MESLFFFFVVDITRNLNHMSKVSKFYIINQINLHRRSILSKKHEIIFFNIKSEKIMTIYLTKGKENILFVSAFLSSDRCIGSSSFLKKSRKTGGPKPFLRV